ncbi:MAG: restriction endonuclease subunit S [Clostridia bacterium]|nr:restriction endonuclease subunit S [Clostridia bacterium]MBQ6818027.1 restriction endonuclease subunit S [Clostridia bacterium]MBQ9861805.1 restriction endonuclease subunit S [Clostridia bacterium]
MAAKKTTALTAEERLEKALVPTDEQPYEVPKNWCWATIESVNHYKGVSIDPSKEPQKVFELYSVPSSADNYPEIVCGEDIGSSKQAVQKGDVLLCKINPRINRVWKVSKHTENTLLASSEWIVVRNESINTDYLMWCLQSKYFREYMLSNVSGVGGSLMRAQPKFVQKYPIPIAPLAEQKRIVDTITELFADLDKAAENAQTIIDNAESRKSAILHQAFTGKLTKQWRVENGLDMDSWMLHSYADLGKSKLGKMLDKVKNNGIPTPYIRNVNVRWFSFDLTDVATMLASEEERKSLSVKQGDLFICEGGEPGRCAIWKDADCEMIFQKALHRFRPNVGVCSEYLGYTLHYMSLNGQLQEHFTGTTIKHLTGQALAKIKINLPSYEEQQEIVRILDELLADEQRIKEAAEEALAKIELMKKSILADAFRGKLGTNDPSDQPATELLKQILA